MSLQAIVFDFDGVIADTEPVHLKGFQIGLADLGLSLSREEYMSTYLGVTDREAFTLVARAHGRELTDEVVDRLIREKTVRMQALLTETPLVFAGVEGRVREFAAQVPVAIASGALRAEIVAVLTAVGLAPSFPIIVSADDPVDGKPSPAPYRLAMQRLAAHVGANGGFDSSRCVAIEDSHWGITAAKAAGMRVVGVTSSYSADALAAADLVVGSVADLTMETLRRLTSG
jgi:beta-phosphoglucomutase